MIKLLPVIIAIIVIGTLEAYALSRGVNGVLLSGSLALIAGLGGYATAKRKPPAPPQP